MIEVNIWGVQSHWVHSWHRPNSVRTALRWGKVPGSSSYGSATFS
jgi:hypothetical protein